MKKLAALLCFSLLLSASAFACWDQFQKDCKHTGEICDVTMDLPLCIKYRIPAPGGPKTGEISLTDNDGNMYLNSGISVTKINTTTGQQLWTLDYATRNSPGMLYNGTVIYVTESGVGFVCFDTATGNILWQKDVVGMTGGFYSGGGEDPYPTLANGTIYCGSSKGELVEVNAANGNTLHVFNAAMGGAAYTAAPSVDDDGTVFIGGNDYRLTAINGSTGAIKWRASTASSVACTASIDSTGVYVASATGKIFKFNKSTGATIWSGRTTGYINGSGALYNGGYFIGSDDRWIYKFDTQTGLIKWAVYTEDNFAQMTCIIVCAKLFIAGCVDKLVMVDAATGNEDFVCHTTSGNYVGLSYWGGNIIFTSDDGYMYVVGKCDPACGPCSCNAYSPIPTMSPIYTNTPVMPPASTATVTSTITNTFTPVSTFTPTVTWTATPTSTATFTCTRTPTRTATFTYTPAPSLTCTPSFTSTQAMATATSISTSQPAATDTPVISPTNMPTVDPCAGAGPLQFTVKMICDPDSLSNIIFEITSSMELASLPQAVICPHGSKASDGISVQCTKKCVQYTATAVPGDPKKYKVTCPKTAGYGDIDSVAVTGTDICGRQCTSDGSYTKTDASDQDVRVFKNVFRPDDGERCMLHYKVYGNERVTIKVYNRSGQLIDTIVNGETKAAGEYDCIWDGKNQSGETVASGIYDACVSCQSYTVTEKMSVLR
jgi:outer membrane protein assembly factor BamB